MNFFITSDSENDAILAEIEHENELLNSIKTGICEQCHNEKENIQTFFEYDHEVGSIPIDICDDCYNKKYFID